MRITGGFSLSREVEDILVADAALTIGFALVLSGGIFGLSSIAFLYLLPISFVAVSLSFVLHELMHKFVAQRFGAMAAFRKSDSGILITLATSLFGFLVGLPGATMIYAPHFTRKEEAYVSLAGPLTNFAVFAVFFALGSALFPGFGSGVTRILFGASLSSFSYLQIALSFIVFISIYLAFFNMLPIFPLDGSKVYRWNRGVFAAVIAVIFVLLTLVVPLLALLPGLVLILIIALLLSQFYRAVAF
ncbi:MAG: site-2 protease family protein [Candidatus Micrarchaeota archaeon]|nr:site-2 protease family protein [Candidatus Micrarchaeota archaeon]